MLITSAHLPTITQNDVIVTNVRHYEALNNALEAIHRVQEGLTNNIPVISYHKIFGIVFPLERILREK